MAQIDTYRSLLGSGGRDGRFSISLTIPMGLDLVSTKGEEFAILATAVDFPAPRKLQTTKTYFAGQPIEIPMDKGDTEQTLTFKFINDEKFAMYRTFVRWIALFGTQKFSDDRNVIDSANNLTSLKTPTAFPNSANVGSSDDIGTFAKIPNIKDAVSDIKIMILGPRWNKGLYCVCEECFPTSITDINMDRKGNELVTSTVTFVTRRTQYYGYNNSLI